MNKTGRNTVVYVITLIRIVERERKALLTDEGGATRVASAVHAILRNDARQVLIDDRNCAMHAIRASDVGGKSKLSER